MKKRCSCNNIIINKKDATPEMIRKHLENSKLLTGANIQDIKVGDTLLKTISGILEGMTSGFEKSGINIETLVTTALIKALSLNQSK